MRVTRILPFFVLMMGLAGSANAQPHCGSPATANLYRFCYDGKAWQIDEPTNARFTDRDRVEVEVVRLNYFRYTLSFDVQEQKSEAYQYLNKLWTSVLSVGVGSLTGALDDATKKRSDNETAFLRRLIALVRASQALDAALTRAVAAHRLPGLSPAEAKILETNLGNNPQLACDDEWKPGAEDPLVRCPIVALSQRTIVAFNDLERGILTDPEQFALSTGITYAGVYETAKKAYGEVRARSDQFQSLAQRSLGSERRKVGKRDAGVRLTLTLSAVDAAGGRSPIGDVSYVVESSLPLVVHGGLVFSRLNDVTFEKVKRANGFSEDDLFAKKNDEANSRNFTLFMGWRLGAMGGGRPKSMRVSAMLSLGTDVDSPGKKIYVAPTLLFFNRVAVSYGAALGKESEGQQQTLEPDIFRIVKARPSAAQFFSISTRIF